MLHLFTFDQDHLVLDSNSGALHQVDEIAYAVLDLFNDSAGETPAAEALARLRMDYGPEVDSCVAEIRELIASGDLFASVPQVSPEQLYPDGPRFKSMCLHLCHDCNMRCRYCFAGTGDFGTGKRSMLDLETGKRAVDFLIADSGSRHNLDIDFFGGEPLLNWPVVTALVEYCAKRAAETGKDIRLTITTNALLLDSEKIAYINQHFSNCVLSIDGREEVHDYMRPDAGGKATHARIVRRIQEFVAARGGKTYYLRGTYTRENLDFSADVLYLAQLARDVSVEPVVAEPGSGYEIRQEDLPQIISEYRHLAREMLKAENEGRGFNFFHFMLDNSPGPCALKRMKGCGAGLEYCSVTPDGDIYPCHQFVGNEQFILGNVNQQPVHIKRAVQEPFTELLLPQKKECQSCWARLFCSGGCAANAFHSTGRVDGIYEIGCAIEKARLECALWLKAKRTES